MHDRKNAIQKADPQEIEVRSSRSRPQTSRPTTWTYRPNVDIFDTADEVLLVADLPGALRETIDVSTEAGILTIQGEVAPRHGTDARVALQEYGVGGFHRRFEIDSSIDTQHIAAEYRDGVLTVRLPKSQQARRRRVPVTA
jgi:HSP20 family molecular chaperone IbpA